MLNCVGRSHVALNWKGELASQFCTLRARPPTRPPARPRPAASCQARPPRPASADMRLQVLRGYEHG